MDSGSFGFTVEGGIDQEQLPTIAFVDENIMLLKTTNGTLHVGDTLVVSKASWIVFFFSHPPCPTALLLSARLSMASW